MLNVQSRLQPLSGRSLKSLHRAIIEDPGKVREFLEALRLAEVELGNGVDRKSQYRIARVDALGDSTVDLRVENITFHPHEQIYFEFEFKGVGYFLVASPRASREPDIIEISYPKAIYEAERRDLFRESVTDRNASSNNASSNHVEFHDGSGMTRTATLRDVSYQGLSLAVPKKHARELRFPLALKFLDGDRKGESVYGDLKHTRGDTLKKGWVQLGMSISRVPTGKLIDVERHRSLLGGGAGASAWRRISFAGAMAKGGSARVVNRLRRPLPHPDIDVVEYLNNRGQRIRAIINHTGDFRGAPAVVIPPAWGRTKETMLPLAATLIRMFEKAGQPLVVLRFDGTNRRGESYIDPRYSNPGDEYLGFRFSQAVDDITASLDFLEHDSRFGTREMVLLTISMGAIEGRRAIAQETRDRLKGWVSLVGMVDLQSGLRSVSGGVDYAYGLAQGLKFGRHELVGVTADMDLTGGDAFEHRLVLFEDAKRDMERIKIPITWLHGRYDAWMDLDRVRNLLSAGDIRERRLIEVPTGHQLRSSRQALETFQVTSREVSSMLLGRELEHALPDLATLEGHSKAERSRRPKISVDLRAFWRDYLLGRDRNLGIELMTATSAYRRLMSLQLERLGLERSQHVLDLGSGAGDFPLRLVESCGADMNLRVTEVDFVTEALRRGRTRLQDHLKLATTTNQISTASVAANLDISTGVHIPLGDEIADAALLSLLISYLEDAEGLVREVARVLRPGGRLVLSSLSRDADISKIYVDGIAELPPDRVQALFGETGMNEFGELQRWFLSDAAKLLDLEEEGRFRFWDADELADMVAAAGFEHVRSEPSFGDPPQAVVISAIRRA